jgi:hypothetical protein
MIDPATLITCPICNGEGYIITKCPIPLDTDTDCAKCGVICGTVECDCCDGYGDVKAETLKDYRKWT